MTEKSLDEMHGEGSEGPKTVQSERLKFSTAFAEILVPVDSIKIWCIWYFIGKHMLHCRNLWTHRKGIWYLKFLNKYMQRAKKQIWERTLKKQITTNWALEKYRLTKTAVENGVSSAVVFLVRFFPGTVATVPFLVTQISWAAASRGLPTPNKLASLNTPLSVKSSPSEILGCPL